MKRSPLWWLNVVAIAVYAVLALFVDANGQILGMSTSASTFVMRAFLFGGAGIAAFSLFKFPKQWPVPALCLLVYLAFAL